MNIDLGGIFSSFMDSVGNYIHNIIASLISILPDSPFTYLEATPEIKHLLAQMNYFIPIDYMISLMEAWLIAIAIYYAYMLILRWIKAIE